MPVRSLISPVLIWPDRKRVESALRQWLDHERTCHPELTRFGFFGSYARGNWGVGSDLDLVAIVACSDLPFASRSREWRTEKLPVPAELLVYTIGEWHQLQATDNLFSRTLAKETIWIFP